jgi:hypothetical protein
VCATHLYRLCHCENRERMARIDGRVPVVGKEKQGKAGGQQESVFGAAARVRLAPDMRIRGTGGFHWQNGGFSVRPSELERVVEYVEDQEAHHRLLSFQDEYRRLLKQHNIEYDERYAWD